MIFIGTWILNYTIVHLFDPRQEGVLCALCALHITLILAQTQLKYYSSFCRLFFCFILFAFFRLFLLYLYLWRILFSVCRFSFIAQTESGDTQLCIHIKWLRFIVIKCVFKRNKNGRRMRIQWWRVEWKWKRYRIRKMISSVAAFQVEHIKRSVLIFLESTRTYPKSSIKKASGERARTGERVERYAEEESTFDSKKQ